MPYTVAFRRSLTLLRGFSKVPLERSFAKQENQWKTLSFFLGDRMFKAESICKIILMQIFYLLAQSLELSRIFVS